MSAAPFVACASHGPSAADHLDSILMGEHIVGSGEPSAEDAAKLVRQVMAAGTVARLDLIHGALLGAFRAGQAAERRESDRLAEEAAARFAEDAQRLAAAHAQQFSAAHLERARALADRDALPWHLQ